jgi:putative acetyltransferase
MQIRRAEATDEKALATLRRCAILTLAVPVLSREEVEKWAMQVAPDRITRAIREHDVWVAEEEGAMCYAPIPMANARIAIGWIEVDRERVAALYVAPSCSCRGVGSALLALAETYIRSSGYLTAHLDASQNALDFYLRRGYVRCGPPNSDGAYPLAKELTAVSDRMLRIGQ